MSQKQWWEDERYQRPIGAEQAQSVTHPPAPRVVTRRFFWTRVSCEQCGKEFFPKRRVQGVKFCSSACRQKHYRRTKKLET